MEKSKKTFYIVDESILPDGLYQTAKAKELLAKGEVSSVSEATERLGIAKSTFYKYRDGIFSYYDLGGSKIANLSLSLSHTPGVLSKVLGAVADYKGNILTINQGLPSDGAAVVTLSVGTENATDELKALVDSLLSINGVLNVKIDGANR